MATPRFPYTDLKEFIAHALVTIRRQAELRRRGHGAESDPDAGLGEIVTHPWRPGRWLALLFEQPTRGEHAGRHQPVRHPPRGMAWRINVADVDEIGDPDRRAWSKPGAARAVVVGSGIRRRPGQAAAAQSLYRRRRVKFRALPVVYERSARSTSGGCPACTNLAGRRGHLP
jgi:hypothetical protein